MIVDGQFRAPYARQFRAYVDRLKKKIERVYLSHRHPDHWYGIPVAFSDQTIYALPSTIQWVNDNGKRSFEDHVNALKQQIGEQEANKLVPSTRQFTDWHESLSTKMEPIKPHEETIDGVKYLFEEENDGEVEAQLTIKLPDLGVAIVQDLIYSGTHLYLSKTMDHWRRIFSRTGAIRLQNVPGGARRPSRQRRATGKHGVSHRCPTNVRQRNEGRRTAKVPRRPIPRTPLSGYFPDLPAALIRQSGGGLTNRPAAGRHR